MTTTEMEFITQRFDGTDDRMDRIENGISDLRRLVSEHRPCPSPGLSMIQQPVIAANAAMITKIEARILAIERWQAWMTGVGAVLISLMTIFGPTIQRLFNIQ